MKNIYEITRASEKELLTVAKQRIDSFPLLKKIYSDAFLSVLVRNKYDVDNCLLVLLTLDNPIDGPISLGLFKDVEYNLDLLQSEGSLLKFTPKLRQWKSIYFESAITELEFASDYKKRGFNVELEPILPSGRTADFLASNVSLKIYFEVKCLFWKRSLSDNGILDDLQTRFSGMNQPFVFGIELKNGFTREQTPKAAKHIRRKLKQLEQDSVTMPYSFAYPETGEPIIEVDVVHRFTDGEQGYYSGAVFGGEIKSNWNDLRDKISSGISQLHPDHPGVLILQPYGLGTGQYDIQNALFGDLAVTLLDNLPMVRSKNRIFAKSKNKRLSVVIFYKKRLHDSGYVKEKIVYHNPYAKLALSPALFSGGNVIQFVPRIDDGKIFYEKIVG